MVKMETDTLSNYEQTQDKHVLDDSMEINIPRNEELNDSHESKDICLGNTQLCLKDSSDNTDDFKVSSESSENKENENDGDRYNTNNDDTHQENKTGSDKDSEIDDDIEESETVESEEKNLNNTPNGDTVLPSDGENELSNDQEVGVLNNKGIVSEDKDVSTTEHIETTGDASVALTSDCNQEEDSSSTESVNNEKSRTEVTSVCLEEQNKSEDERDNKDSNIDEDKNAIVSKESGIQKEDKGDHEGKDDSEIEEDKNDCRDKNESKESEVQEEDKDDHKGKDESKIEENKNDCRDNEENIKEGKNKVKSKKSVVEEQDEGDSSIEDTSKHCPLLKETLIKGRLEDEQSKEAEGENGIEDIDMDEDFDPSLLCPDIAMEIDEAPVITSNEIPPADGNKSPLLYEPIFSTYVDEMTGAEVSFNLSVEEHKLRQDTFGEANPVQYTKVHCTACNVHLGSALDGQSNRFVHPLLKVLICKDCYHFYTSGEFEKDEDGSELYCRWCGQGGQVICCSSCEMVFCKKCIRINYGRKKLTEIRDSDDWLCFRCDPAQLTSLRVHCAEFMEYVRREISRAATLENATSFMTTDYTQCCLAQKKKYVDPHPNEPKKKKRKSVHDPDYDPMKDRSVSPQPQPSTSMATITPIDPSQKLVPILPKPGTSSQSPVVMGQIGQTNAVFRVGNTTFRPRSSTFSQPRPRVQVINPAPNVRQQMSGPGYIKILPGGIRVPPPIRAQNTQQFRPRQPSFQFRPARPTGPNPMKHEWFEKTVRAAARVNSNLSYTLTQLNRAQASATSVEALAVVHNKLQEILSTSINSLIQIRKNLRTEFIAGIKNIRFPPKSTPPQPSTSSQDDDVIFVSPNPTANSVPPPLVQASTSNSPLTSINLPPSVSLTKRIREPPSATASSSAKASPTTSNGNDKPKVFLRVKSLTALQNVPSECITIPDDPLPPPPPLTPLNQLEEITIIDNSSEKNDEIKDKSSDSIEVIEVTSTTVDSSGKETGEKSAKGGKETEEKTAVDGKDTEDEKEAAEKPAENTDSPGNSTNGDKETEDAGTKKERESNHKKVNEDSGSAVAFDAVSTSTVELKKLFNVKIHITRSNEIDEKVKRLFGLVNGDSSE